MVDGPLGNLREKVRDKTEAYYERKEVKEPHHKAPDEKKAKMESKPDANGHQGKNVFGKGKQECLPGQMYVNKKVHNESDFAGEQKQKQMY